MTDDEWRAWLERAMGGPPDSDRDHTRAALVMIAVILLMIATLTWVAP